MSRLNVDFQGAEHDPPAPPLPAPTSDGDYLDEEWLEALRRRPFTFTEAARFLVETFPEAVRLMWCPSVSVTETTDSLGLGDEVYQVRFATGGWSGAEALIKAIKSHFWMAHFLELWRRGGLYVFEVPKRDLKEVPHA